MPILSKSANTKWIYGVVMVYMALAFGWWAYMLMQSNNSDLKHQLIQLAHDRGVEPGAESLTLDPDYAEYIDAYNRNYWQIIGEGIFFVLTLIMGLYLLNRSYRQEIENKTRQKNFLLSITHELRSPLSSNKLVLETIKKRELPRTQQIELIDGALIESERLNTLVSDMLLAVRMDEIYEPHYERVDIRELFDNTLRIMRFKFPSIDWTVSSELNENTVVADKTGLTSILVNLLENAAKYSNNKGPVDVIFTQANNNILLKVADQGIGIPLSERSKVFERFYRVGDESVRKSKGTGLGLYLVKKLVDTYGGEITIKDNKPKGTIFDVSLPINKPEHQAL